MKSSYRKIRSYRVVSNNEVNTATEIGDRFLTTIQGAVQGKIVHTQQQDIEMVAFFEGAILRIL